MTLNRGWFAISLLPWTRAVRRPTKSPRSSRRRRCVYPQAILAICRPAEIGGTHMLRKSLMLWLTAFLGHAAGQGQADLAKLLDRLDRMEAENRKLQDEIHSLRSEIATLAAGTATSQDLAARADVQENRTAELAQSKVDASQRMPIALTGMLLFNAFLNGKQSGTSEYPVVASATTGPAAVGATLRQSVIGLTFNGPELPGGGKASGSVYMDFFPGGIYAGDNTFRLRVA